MTAAVLSADKRIGQRGWAVPAAGLLAALCYSSFLLGPLLGRPELTDGPGFISEAESSGQPYAWLLRSTDVLAGVAMLLLARGLVPHLPSGRQRRTGLILLVLTGLASILDGLSRMGCNPSSDRACAESERSVSGLFGQLADLHSQTGLLGFAGAAGGAILLGGALASRAPGVGTVQVVLGVLVAACGLADLGLLLAGWQVGPVERIRTVATSGWLLSLAMVPVRRWDPRPTTGGRR